MAGGSSHRKHVRLWFGGWERSTKILRRRPMAPPRHADMETPRAVSGAYKGRNDTRKGTDARAQRRCRCPAAYSFVTPSSHLYNTSWPGLQAICHPGAGESMLSDVYNTRILELAADIPRLGRLTEPDASATAHSRLCGSTVTVDLVLRDGRVADFAHDVKACALGQASSSIMARTIIGATPSELREFCAAIIGCLQSAVLKETGRSPPAAVDRYCGARTPSATSQSSPRLEHCSTFHRLPSSMHSTRSSAAESRQVPGASVF